MIALADIAHFLSGFPQVARATVELEPTTNEVLYIRAVGLRALTAESTINWLALDQAHPPQQIRAEHALALGDIVVSARGSAAKISLISHLPSGPVYSTTNVIVVRPNQLLVDPIYLWACLTKLRNDPREVFFARGSTMVWSITLRDLARLPIHLPSLEEQRRIASAVLSLREAADSARAVANQYDRTLNAYIGQILSDQIHT